MLKPSIPSASSESPPRNLSRDENGNVAIIAALAILPILGVAGMAIDFQYAVSNKQKVQAILDSAVVAGSRALQDGANKEDVRGIVQNYFANHLSANGSAATCPTATVRFREDFPEEEQASVGEYDIRAEVLCDQPTTLSAVMGKDRIAYRTSTGSTYGIGKIDVAFVFDSSGSMSGQRLADLKEAAEAAVNELLPESGDEDVRLAMVAYAGMLNAGEYFEDVVESTTYTGMSGRFWTFEPDDDDVCDRTRQRWRNGVRRTQYRCRTPYEAELPHTCVWERGGAEAYTDALPGDGQWLQPGDEDDHTQHVCPDSEPLPLTNDREELFTYIEELGADGYTAGHLGAAWGWYMLSPDWAPLFPEDAAPLPYDEPDSAKAIILMTDGAFNREYFDDELGDSDDQARAMCDAIKANSNIRIYSVAFQAPNSGEAVLEYCASGAGFYFDPSNGDELEAAYQTIASSISDLRINR
ncbi:MAG: TadE/TadG family type IV pilus assembly protein [Pseudomonadota bacterium]